MINCNISLLLDQVGAVDIFEQNTNLDWVYSTSNYNYFSDFQSRSGCYLTSSASNVFILPCPNASSLGNLNSFNSFKLLKY